MEKLVANVDRMVFDIERILDAQPQRLLPFAGMDKSDAAPCTRFLRDECKLGDRCPYRHMRRDKPVVCKHWLRGLCKKGDACEWLHARDPDKMPECHFFASYGQCSNSDCPFLHKKPKLEECPWYARGFCRHGPNCKRRHVRKTMCPDYELGQCPRGSACHLPHHSFDLPAEAVKSDPKDPESIRCHYCKESGHVLDGCPVLAKKLVVTKCHYCKENGHQLTNCPVLAKKLEAKKATEKCPVVTVAQSGERQQGRPVHSRPMEEVTCFKCNEKGHYANRCPVTNHGQRLKRPYPVS